MEITLSRSPHQKYSLLDVRFQSALLLSYRILFHIKNVFCVASQEYTYTHLSAGDLLREERAREGSECGQLIASYIKEGKIVPVEITISLLQKVCNNYSLWTECNHHRSTKAGTLSDPTFIQGLQENAFKAINNVILSSENKTRRANLLFGTISRSDDELINHKNSLIF